MISEPGKQTIVIHILPNISWSTSNQAMKLGQLKEYSRRNFFLEKSYTKCFRKTSHPFLKKQNWAYLSINSLKMWKRENAERTFAERNEYVSTGLLFYQCFQVI